MSAFAFLKYQYAVWDGSNVAEIREFVTGAFVADDGTLRYPTPGGDSPLATRTGICLVGQPGGAWPSRIFESEAAFLAAYSPVSS
ncbi:hypothetical protein [Amycolatopsis rubida]|uniref:Uncharacterized protein n=1 Tax=Amycolatopsis rubida TaxID=112413 RepID=A0A1I5IG53_9PSEU|nr:hypothetical protein [Amycolatopsis rubida]SFO59533.1 hypothetical protein SAMN05421854_102452 [Amycolatopsis rubida]